MTAPAPAVTGAMTAAVAAAILAPSMHNTQPWRFRINPPGLEVWADRSRQLAVADRHGWAVRIACGAAVANARLALAGAGLRVDTALRPDSDSPDLMARLAVTGQRPPTPRELELLAAVPRRHSNRYPFNEAPVPAAVRAELVAAARDGGAWLELLVGRVPLALIAEVTSAADTALRRDPAYTAELAAWADEVATGPGPAGHDLLMMRDFGTGARQGGRDFESDPLVAIVATTGDTPYDQLVAGIALQQVLLAATGAGLAASLLSQPIEVPAARDQLRRGLGRRGYPQIVARIGYGQPGVPSPRRSVAEFMWRDAPDAG